MADFSFFKCEYIPKQEIWKQADQFRENYWQEDTLPVDIEFIIEANLNMHIEPSHSILRLVKIDAYLKPDFSGIVVDYEQYMDDQNRYANRLRFSFAHEIGHYILHKKIYQEFNIETIEEYHDFIINAPEKDYSFFEGQANQFAGRLLVPPNKLIEKIQEIKSDIKENDLEDLLKREPEMVLEGVAPKICKPFGVSDQVIIRRTREEQLWPPS